MKQKQNEMMKHTLLCRQPKGYPHRRENLKNAKEAIEEFEKEYRQDIKDVARQEYKEGTFRREELAGRFTARKLFRWLDKRYNQEYWERMERNWRQQKGRQSGERKIETITEEKNSGVKEWTEEDDNEMDNIIDPYYELQEIPQDEET